MKTVFATLTSMMIFVSATSFAGGSNVGSSFDVKPKTLKCDISYVLELSNNHIKWDEIKPVEAKLERDIDAPRLVVSRKASTSDGKYEISVFALQPLKGDLTKYEQVSISVKDLETKITYIPGDILVTRATHDIDRAHFQITTDEGPKSLIVECELK